MNTWLIKSEPDVYPYSQLVEDGRTDWTGIRNYTARINLNAMAVGDHCLYYHSGTGKEIVGIAKVVSTAVPDATCPEDPRWVSVGVAPLRLLARPVTLAEIKAHPVLSLSELVRQSRLSVAPFTAAEYALVLELSGS
jgi:predicted RNA-binding protein with PUA-like domain